MSEAAAEILHWGGEASPMGEQDLTEGESSIISNSDLDPFSSEFINSSADETSSPKLAITTSKTTSPYLALNSSDGSEPSASFERWCVDQYAKFYSHIHAYYFLFLLIVDYIVKFIQISWSVFRRSISVVGNLLSIVMQHTDASSEPFTQRQNLQQSLGTVPRSPSIDPISLMFGKSSTFSRNGRAIPQTLEQQRSPATSRLELSRHQTIKSETRTIIGSGRKDPVPMVRAHRSTTVVEKKSVEIRSVESSRTGSLSYVPIVHVRRWTSIVEDYWSVGLQPSTWFARLGHNPQKSDGRKGFFKQATPKHGPKTGEKASSSKQRQSSDPRRDERHPRAGNAETRTHDVRKGAHEHATSKRGFKTGEKATSSKQHQNTDIRWDERRHRAGNAATETRTHGVRKDVHKQATPKHGSKTGEKASSNKQRQITDPRREEKRPRTGNNETQTQKRKNPKNGAATGKKATSNKQRQNTDKDSWALCMRY